MYMPVPAAYAALEELETVAGVPPVHAPFRAPVALSSVSPLPGIDQLQGAGIPLLIALKNVARAVDTSTALAL
jgi:hypothetical protein